MANDYLVSKWKIWYKALDVNHDGKISIEDVQESRSKFTDLHKLNPEKAKEVEQSFTEWWNTYIFNNKEGDISESDFVGALNGKFSADKAAFKKFMSQCFDKLFDVIDTNKDRSISEEEFLIAFKAYGHENVALDTKFFNAYNPKDGLIPLRQVVDSWIEFATSEDASKGDVVKTAFEGGV